MYVQPRSCSPTPTNLDEHYDAYCKMLMDVHPMMSAKTYSPCWDCNSSIEMCNQTMNVTE